MTTDGKFTGEGLIFLRLRQLSGFYLPTLWEYIRWLLVYTVKGYHWIVSSFPICYWLLQQQYYCSTTTAAGGNCTPGYRGGTAL